MKNYIKENALQLITIILLTANLLVNLGIKDLVFWIEHDNYYQTESIFEIEDALTDDKEEETQETNEPANLTEIPGTDI